MLRWPICLGQFAADVVDSCMLSRPFTYGLAFVKRVLELLLRLVEFRANLVEYVLDVHELGVDHEKMHYRLVHAD